MSKNLNRFNLQIDPELAKRTRAISILSGMTLSELVEKALVSYFNNPHPIIDMNFIPPILGGQSKVSDQG
jgi:hypothetical protein